MKNGENYIDCDNICDFCNNRSCPKYDIVQKESAQIESEKNNIVDEIKTKYK